MKPINYAIVGVGGYGIQRRKKLRQAGCFRMLGGLDITPSALDQAEEEEGHPLRRYENLSELVADPEVEAVVVSTPAHLHVEQAFEAARAGKAIFVEKPLGHNLEECRALVEYCEANEIAHGHGFSSRFDPIFVHAKKMIDDGMLGKLVGVAASQMSTLGLVFPKDNWRFHPERNPGGPLFQCGIHKIDLLRFLIGEGQWLSGVLDRHLTESETEDSLILIGLFGGVPVTFHSHYVASYRHGMEFYGTHGTLLISEYPTRIEFKETDWEGNPEPLQNIIDLVKPVEAERDALRDFARAVRERRQPSINGRDGLRAVELVHQAVEVATAINQPKAGANQRGNEVARPDSRVPALA